MVRSLLPIFVALILLFVFHSAKAQQLPDSLLAKHEPMMILPDSSAIIAVIPGDSIFGYQAISIYPWPNFGGYSEGYPWPGIYTLTVTEFPSFSWTCVTIDTTLLIPHANSFVGTKAKVVIAQKIPDAALASAFAGNFHRFTKKEE